MLKKLATLVGYQKVPKLTFLARHRKKGMKTLMSWKATKMVAKRPVSAAVGAAVALPVAVFTFRKLGQSG